MTDAASAEMVLDFSGAPPAEGPLSDYVPPGTYVVSVVDVTMTTSKKNKPMLDARLEVSRGPLKGKRLRDLFSIPEANTDDSNYGLQRLNSLLVATRGKQAAGRNKVSSVIGAVKGKECIADVDDRELPPKEGQQPTIVSNIVAYYFPKSEAGRARIAALRGDGAAAPAATPAAPPVEDELAADDGLEDELGGTPAAEATAEAPVAEEVAPEEPTTTTDEEDLESLFE